MRLPGKLLPVLLTLILCGCATGNFRAVAVPDTDVFGVRLFSTADYRTLRGVAATEEPCVRGYERVFDELDLVVGYGFDRRVRKITTRNRNTSICGVKPGMSLAEGRQLVLRCGLAETHKRGTFRSDPYTLTFLVDGAGSIFGITLQVE